MNRGLLLGPLLLMTACGSGQQHATRNLDNRLQDRLASDIAAGTVVLQPLPAGAQVTLLDASLYPNDVKALDNQRLDVRASVIEALLDPALMRVQVADTSALPDEQRAARVRNVNQYFVDNGLEATLLSGDPTAAPVAGAPLPAGLTITISVQCPNTRFWWGYDDGKSHPVCE